MDAWSRGARFIGDVAPTSEVREHCCAAILRLAKAISHVGSTGTVSNRSWVEATVLDLHGGLIKYVLGDKFTECDGIEAAADKHSSEVGEVFDSCREQTEQIVVTRPFLAAVGLPLRSWMVEHRARLFDHNRKPAHEPAFSQQYLERVAEAMWVLSTRIFGEGIFSYEELADFVREPIVERVKGAARRVHCEVSAESKQEVLWLGRDTWRWNRQVEKKQITIRYVMQALDRFHPPKPDSPTSTGTASTEGP
jgi:hypothetical protein